jgi:hypothetical protein
MSQRTKEIPECRRALFSWAFWSRMLVSYAILSQIMTEVNHYLGPMRRKSRGLVGALAACHMLQSGGLISPGGTSVQIADRSQAFDSLDTLGSSRHLESRAWSAKVGRRELSRIVD